MSCEHGSVSEAYCIACLQGRVDELLEVYQSDKCRIRELTAQVQRLEAERDKYKTVFEAIRELGREAVSNQDITNADAYLNVYVRMREENAQLRKELAGWEEAYREGVKP